jgi:tripartite-type tricarboxylate transporter receptor subunit TctC
VSRKTRSAPVRRALLQLGAALVTASMMAPLASAQGTTAFPSKPISVVVPMSPGGATDVVARIFAQQLSQALGQPALVENKPGATGAIGATHVARAAADGHTLLVGPSSVMVVNPLVTKAPYDVARDFRPVGLLARAETIIVTNPASGFKTLNDVIQYAKKNPGKLAFGSNGQGGAFHLAGEFLQLAAGIELLHVPYKGAAPAETALMSGEIGLMVTNTVSVLPHIRSGRLVPLAIASPGRSRELPNVPHASDTVPGYVVDTWVGLYAPAGTSDAAITRLSGVTNAFLRAPENIEAMRARGLEPVPGTPEDAVKFQNQEMAMWTRVVTEAKAKGRLD